MVFYDEIVKGLRSTTMELWIQVVGFVQDNVVATVAILALLVAYEALRIVRDRSGKSS